MKVMFARKLMKTLFVCGLLASLQAMHASAQLIPESDSSVEVTSNESTWLVQPTDNSVDIPAGADGVVINNGVGGRIISGAGTAINTAASTEINNDGLVAGGTNGVNFVNGLGSGSLNNGPGGVIRSDSRAVNIGGQVALTNDGQIVGTGDQRNGTVYSDSVADSFSIVNRGTIDAGAGNQGSGVGLEIGQNNNATIENAGTIQGRTNTPGVSAGTGASGDGLRLANFGATGNFSGSISNSADGAIRSESQSGPIAGLRVGDGIAFQGDLDNAGEISGRNNGLYFGDADHTGGEAKNSGVISSDSRALNIDGVGLKVSNTGDIVGTGNQRNGTVYADSTAQDFTLTNSGKIDAGAGNEGAGFSVELDSGGNDFTINNTGTIAGRGNASAGAATAGDGIRLERTRVGGALEGSTTGLFTGTINNAGDIFSDGANGTVGGFRAVNGVSFQGTLNNTGTIAGTQNGVYFGNPTPAGGGDHTGGVVNNNGVISSDSRALNVDGIGLTVNNAGEILATGRQRNGTLYVDGTANNFEINNSGSIDASGGAGSGVSIQVGAAQRGNLTNSGTIRGSGDQSVDAGIRLFTNEETAVFTGDITNQAGGVISGGQESLAVLIGDNVAFDGTLFNAGQIIGGIDINSGSLALSDSSILSLEISSLTEFDTVSAGQILFDGTLELSFVDDFLVQEGDTFDLFSFGPDFSALADTDFASGSFDAIFANGVRLDTTNLLSSGSVSVASVSAVPEPSSFGALAIGIAGFALRRRRTC